MSEVRKITLYVLIFVLILPIFYFTNVPKIKAADIKSVQIYSSTKVDGDQYIVTLKWKNVPENQTSIDPDSGSLLYEVYKDGQKIKTVQQDLVNDNIFTDTMTKDEAQKTHTYYVIVNITRPAAQSVPSNTVTVTKDSFTTPIINNPPEAGTIPAPRVVGSISGTTVTLKWDRTTYSGCDPDSGQILYRIYRDNNQINATQVTGYTGTYTDTLSGDDAKTTHTYYVTTYCTRTADTIGGKESAPSNKIQYNPGQNDQPGTITNPDGVVYTDNDINPPQQKDESCGFKGSWVATRIAEVICAFIQGIGEMSQWIIDTLFTGTFNA